MFRIDIGVGEGRSIAAISKSHDLPLRTWTFVTASLNTIFLLYYFQVHADMQITEKTVNPNLSKS